CAQPRTSPSAPDAQGPVRSAPRTRWCRLRCQACAARRKDHAGTAGGMHRRWTPCRAVRGSGRTDHDSCAVLHCRWKDATPRLPLGSATALPILAHFTAGERGPLHAPPTRKRPMQVRRCKHMVVEPRESLDFDLARLFAGGTGLGKRREWVALAAHRDAECVLNTEDLALLGALSPDDWQDAR